jgi:hypothetical protein
VSGDQSTARAIGVNRSWQPGPACQPTQSRALVHIGLAGLSRAERKSDEPGKGEKSVRAGGPCDLVGPSKGKRGVAGMK